jgi:hypothetical protein
VHKNTAAWVLAQSGSCLQCYATAAAAALMWLCYTLSPDDGAVGDRNWHKQGIRVAILTPLNEDVDLINKKVMNMFADNADGRPAASTVYKSCDSLNTEDNRVFFPVEFLNSLNFAGMPPHELHLKIGCPIIMMRSLSNGLANGTRIIVTGLTDHVREAKVATGPEKGRIFTCGVSWGGEGVGCEWLEACT